jgi:hypothetical protein
MATKAKKKSTKGKLMVRPVYGSVVLNPKLPPKNYRVEGQVVLTNGKVLPKRKKKACKKEEGVCKTC